MTIKERMMAAVAGEQVDIIPYSLWSHITRIDLEPELSAEKNVQYWWF